MNALRLLGQGAQWARLLGQARTLRMPHGVVLAGPRGAGKSTAARVLAQALLCEGEGPSACGACNACVKVAADAHPDVHTLTVPEDKQEIPVDAVRELREVLMRHALEGRARVAFVDPADRLNEQGQNALLKTLEEPGRNTFLLLPTSRPEYLLETVRSRSAFVRLATLDQALIAAELERAGLGTVASRAWAAGCAGTLGLARELIEAGLEAVHPLVVGAVSHDDDLSAVARARAVLAGGGSRAELDHRARLVLSMLRSVLRGDIYGRLAFASDGTYGGALCDRSTEHLEAAFEAEVDLDLKIGAERALTALFLRLA